MDNNFKIKPIVGIKTEIVITAKDVSTDNLYYCLSKNHTLQHWNLMGR